MWFMKVSVKSGMWRIPYLFHTNCLTLTKCPNAAVIALERSSVHVMKSFNVLNRLLSEAIWVWETLNLARRICSVLQASKKSIAIWSSSSLMWLPYYILIRAIAISICRWPCSINRNLAVLDKENIKRF